PRPSRVTWCGGPGTWGSTWVGGSTSRPSAPVTRCRCVTSTRPTRRSSGWAEHRATSGGPQPALAADHHSFLRSRPDTFTVPTVPRPEGVVWLTVLGAVSHPAPAQIHRV